MVLYDSIWKDCPDTIRSTGAYTVFYQGGKITVSQNSAVSEYIWAFTTVMDPANLGIINKEPMNKDKYMFTEQAPLIILYRKSAVCMANNGKYNKHTIHIGGKMQFLRNGEEWNMHKTLWCEGGLKFSYIVTNNVREDELNPLLWYTMIILDNWQNNCTRGLIGYRMVWVTRCYDGIYWIVEKWNRLGVELDSTQLVLTFQWFWIDENNIKNCFNNFSDNM